MIAKITPLIRLPSKTDVFDYHIPDELKNKIKLGHLVTIPWRTQKIAGVVLGLESLVLSFTQHPDNRDDVELSKTQDETKEEPNKRKKFRARPITNILEDDPVLTKNQLKLINQFANYYFVTPGAVGRLITPDKPKRFIKPKTHALTSSNPHNTFSISKKQLPKLQNATKQISNKVSHIQIQDVSSFIWLIIYLKKHNPDKQILVLFPMIDLIKSIEPIVQKMCSDDSAVIHSELSKGKYWSEYQKILSGKAKIILSTRQAVFLPIQEKSKIIFFESTSQDFKQYEQHPKYDARIVGSWIADITQSQLILTSSSRHSELISKSTSSNNKALNQVQDDALLLPSSSQTNITTKLIDMKQEMSKKDFAIIADSTLDSIKKTLKNNQKILILSLRQDSEEGVSVNKIGEILTNQIKNCKISTKYDSSQNFNILVTTPYSLETLKLNSKAREFGLAVFASIEPLLAIPDFRSSIRTFNKLNFWKMMCQELKIPQILLQSYSPENPAIRAFTYGEVDIFTKAELKHRQELSYPPFADLIKLSYKGDVNYELDRAIKSLKENLGKDTQVLGPFKDKKDNQSILIKISSDTNLSVINSLPFGWMIDRDPENVL